MYLPACSGPRVRKQATSLPSGWSGPTPSLREAAAGVPVQELLGPAGAVDELVRELVVPESAEQPE